MLIRKSIHLMLAVSLLCAASAEEFNNSRVTPVVLAVREAGPSVVNISTERIIERPYSPFFGFAEPFFEDFFRRFPAQFPRTRYKVHSLGSGVIISPDGYVFTNEHVIRKASRITVTAADGREFDAEVLNSSAEMDLAVIKIDSPDPLPYATMGSSADLMIGETLVAVGNPFGLENSVTTGVLSATHRSIATDGDIVYPNLLQTTALINPGNSGGPLLNINAEVIGINTAVRLDAQGIGFAIPIDDVREALVDLLDFEFVKNTSLGVEVARDPSVPPTVKSVRRGGPGASAGIKPNDIIVKVDGRSVSGVLDYQMMVLLKEAGEELSIELERRGEPVKVNLKIGEAPPPLEAESVRIRIGAVVYPLSAYVARRLGVPTDFGILVHKVEPDTPAHAIGLKAGDVIISWDGERLGSVSRLASRLDSTLPGSRVTIDVLRGDLPLEAVLQVK